MLRNDKQNELEQQFRAKLKIFNSKFPSEESCVEAIYKNARKNGKIKCYYCGSRKHSREFGSRTNTCNNCKKETWFTADTFFDHARKIRAWFGVIWLREQGIFISSNKIHNTFGVAPSTGALINKRLDKLIVEQFDDKAKSIPSSIFHKLIFRRSKETPAFEHPSTHSFNNSKKKESKKIPKATLYTKDEKTVLAILTDKPQTFESISKQLKIPTKDLAATISMLEITGAVKRLPGDNYVLSDHKEKPAYRINKISAIAKDELKRIMEFIKIIYQGVSWRYLQIYIANYWCYASRKKFGSGKILTLCLKSRPFDRIDLSSIKSSNFVRIMPIPA